MAAGNGGDNLDKSGHILERHNGNNRRLVNAGVSRIYGKFMKL